MDVVGFGTFGVQFREARTGRNSQTGATIKIPAGKIPIFRPVEALHTRAADGSVSSIGRDTADTELEALRTQLQNLQSQWKRVEADHLRLRREMHEYLEISSFGLNLQASKLTRWIPVSIYLSDDHPSVVKSVTVAFDNVLSAFGFEIEDDYPAIMGSWFKRWITRTKQTLSQPEVLERLQKLERAVELTYLNKPQSDVDKAQAEAAAVLLKALSSVKKAVCKTGSVLIVKLPDSMGSPVVCVRTLSTHELMYLEEHPELLSDPTLLLQKLGAG